MGLLTEVDGINQILLVAMAIQANLVDLDGDALTLVGTDKKYRPLEGLLVGHFGRCFFCA